MFHEHNHYHITVHKFWLEYSILIVGYYFPHFINTNDNEECIYIIIHNHKNRTKLLQNLGTSAKWLTKCQGYLTYQGK